MTTIDDGGPAFPQEYTGNGAWKGMSLRAWLAGQALNGVMSDSGISFKGKNDVEIAKSVAEYVLVLADAVIAALKVAP